MEPSLIHQTCIIDAISRSGRIAEAEEFLTHKMTKPIVLQAFKTFLGACRLYVCCLKILLYI